MKDILDVTEQGKRHKNIFMLVTMILALLCLLLPQIVIAEHKLAFTGIQLLTKPEQLISVTLLGDQTQTILSYHRFSLIIFIGLGLVGTTIPFVKWFSRSQKRILVAITSILMILLTMVTVALSSTPIEELMISAGIGSYTAIFFLILYLTYGVVSVKTPIVEANIYILLIFLGMALVYPYLNTVALSFDSSGEKIGLIPKAFTTNNFLFVVLNSKFYNGFAITLARTFFGTVAALFCTIIFSYGMSKEHLIGGKFYMKMCIFTMYFSGGMVPVFILFAQLGLVNNFMVYIIPNLLNVFNMILVVNYFRGLTPVLEESARMDGANDFKILFYIIVPISKPIIAVIALYNAVFQWNSWYDGYLFMMGRPELKPLQNVLIDIINESQMANFLTGLPIPIKELMTTPVGQSIVAAAIILTIGPIVLFYPYLQRHFIKGMLLGAEKG